MELGSITLKEVKERAFDTALVPIGSCEVHGVHLPYGSDTIIALGLARRVAEAVPGTLVVPPITYGMSAHHGDLPLTITLTPDTVVAILVEVCQGLVRHGIKKIVVVNGHDGNVPLIETAARKIRENTGVTIVSFAAWWEAIPQLTPKEIWETWAGFGHGGEGETSMNLAIHPELVHQERLDGTTFVPLEYGQLLIRYYGYFGEHSTTGYAGDPSKGTREKGERAVSAMVDYIAAFLRDAKANGLSWRTGRPSWAQTPPN